MKDDRINAVGASGVVTDATEVAARWEMFDALPTSVRRALAGAVNDWFPGDFLAVHTEMLAVGVHPARAATLVAAAVERADAREVVRFSCLHQCQHGTPTPHVAAGASVQQYERAA